MSWANDSNFPTPNEDMPTSNKRPVTECAYCGEGITDGDIYFELIEGDCCEACVENFKRTASA